MMTASGATPLDAPRIPVYSARGNVYAIVSQALAHRLCGVPADAATAADRLSHDAIGFVQAVLACLPAHVTAGRPGLSPIDGILLAPFQDRGPFDAIIVNTDGTLAERSGNGLTNLVRCLDDRGTIDAGVPFDLIVHAGAGRITTTRACSAVIDGVAGYWLDMGSIGYGTTAVEAVSAELIDLADGSYTVPQLRAIDAAWRRSVLVDVGNPHCVSFLDEASELPEEDRLRSATCFEPLKRVAFKMARADGEAATAFPHGINLQWACVRPDGATIDARIFERGEGPTASSGTSATAIVAAARHIGLVGDHIRVVMPGGTAHVELTGAASDITARFFGIAERVL